MYCTVRGVTTSHATSTVQVARQTESQYRTLCEINLFKPSVPLLARLVLAITYVLPVMDDITQVSTVLLPSYSTVCTYVQIKSESVPSPKMKNESNLLIFFEIGMSL